MMSPRPRCSNQGTSVSESVAGFVPVHQHLARSAVSKGGGSLVPPNLVRYCERFKAFGLDLVAS